MHNERVDGLAWVWVYIGLPVVLMTALSWILVGCVDVVRGIFSQFASKEDAPPLPTFRLPGAGGVLGGMALAIAAGAAIYRAQENNDCTTECSVFAEHRNEVAWISAQFVAVAAVVVLAFWLLSRRFGWRWMG